MARAEKRRWEKIRGNILDPDTRVEQWLARLKRRGETPSPETIARVRSVVEEQARWFREVERQESNVPTTSD